jgi:hypothetical protein
MRTTLTLDDDNAVRLERLRKQRDISLKEVVNAAIRRGLDVLDNSPGRPAPFRTESFDPGKPLLPIDNIGDTLEMLDEKDFEERRSK